MNQNDIATICKLKGKTQGKDAIACLASVYDISVKELKNIWEQNQELCND